MDRKKAIAILNAEICSYCGSEPELVNSKVIYGRDYGMIYLCRPCDAYVGTHKGTNKPLGRLANSELRHWKKQAHRSFDRIWKQGHMRRQDAYAWLAKRLQIKPEFCHIGMFSVRYCKKTCKISNKYINLNT